MSKLRANRKRALPAVQEEEPKAKNFRADVSRNISNQCHGSLARATVQRDTLSNSLDVDGNLYTRVNDSTSFSDHCDADDKKIKKNVVKNEVIDKKIYLHFTITFKH
uniref:Uncharacterized protein n=1 Tax=Panagrolaimus sp. ES5 TaxID=591445 RepID=A0AC34FEQ9_9BILA